MSTTLARSEVEFGMCQWLLYKVPYITLHQRPYSYPYSFPFHILSFIPPTHPILAPTLLSAIASRLKSRSHSQAAGASSASSSSSTSNTSKKSKKGAKDKDSTSQPTPIPVDSPPAPSSSTDNGRLPPIPGADGSQSTQLAKAVKGPNTLGNQDDGNDALSQTDSSSPSSDATLVGSGSQPPGSNAYV